MTSTSNPESNDSAPGSRTSAARQAVDAALADLRQGNMILVVDDEDRENEGDLIMAAEFATPAALAFIIRHSTGIVCVGISEERADELRLPLMIAEGDDRRGTAFTVSVDARMGTTTGVSAEERSVTVRALASSATRPSDLTRPGHLFPLRARRGGVLQRAGHTESAVDLCRLAGLAPVGVLAEVINDDGTMARRTDLKRFAAQHGLTMIAVADIVSYRREAEMLVRRETSGRVPTAVGEFTAVCFRSVTDDVEHVAFTVGDVDQRGTSADDQLADPVLVRVHSECLTGDVFGSQRCDCGEQLTQSLRVIGQRGRGVVVYLRGHEGRGIGLAHKLRAYELQDGGLDTVDANLAQGLPVDARDYGVGAGVLHDLGVSTMTLLTNNPAKYLGLSGYGITIAGRLPITVQPNPNNLRYLETKRTRMDHFPAANEM